MSSSWLFLIFVATFGLALGALAAVRRLMEDKAPSTEQRPADWDWGGAEVSSVLLKDDQLSTISFWHQLLVRLNGVDIMKARIGEAGLDWSVGRTTAMMLLAAASVLVLASRLEWLPPYLVAALAAAAGSAPYMMVLRRRRQRLEKIQGQFPDMLDALCQSLRAGNPLAAAMADQAREVGAPLGTELRKTVEERNLGLPWEAALENLKTRVPCADVHVFAAAVLLQSKTGGKLHEVLGRLAESMREAEALRGEVRAFTAHGRLSGTILTALPIAMVLMMMYVNPGYLGILWNHPLGRDLVAVAAAALLAAHLVISRLVDIRI